MPPRRSSSRKRTYSKKKSETLEVTPNKKRPQSNENEKKKSKKAKQTHEFYCWKCHKATEHNAETIRCGNCPRVFHLKCLNKANKFNTNETCYVCHKQISDREVFKSCTNLPALVRQMFKSSFPNEKDLSLIKFPIKKNVTPLTDYRVIHDNLKWDDAVIYKTPVDLMDAVYWMYHNCVILYGEKSENAAVAKQIKKSCENELEDIYDCSYCYIYNHEQVQNQKPLGAKEHSYFADLCVYPHPVVWAKIKGYRPWPAKAFRVTGDKVRVRFFGTHQSGYAALKDCYFMTKEYPFSKNVKEDIQVAILDCDCYLSQFKEMYKSYPYEENKVPYNHDKIMKFFKKMREEGIRQNVQASSVNPVITATSTPQIIVANDNAAFSQTVTSSQSVTASQNISEGQNISASQTVSSNQNIATNQNNTADQSEDINGEDFAFNGCLFPGVPQEDPSTSEQNEINEPSDCTGKEIVTYNGRLLPGVHVENQISVEADNDPFGSFAGSSISISNVISGTDMPKDADGNVAFDNNFAENEQPFEFNNIQLSTNLSENSAAVLPSENNTSVLPEVSSQDSDDSDIEVIEVIPKSAMTVRRNHSNNEIVRTILKLDPAGDRLLKKVQSMVKDLFLQYWSYSNQVNKLAFRDLGSHERLNAHQENINALEKKYKDAIQTANIIRRGQTAEFKALEDDYKTQLEELKQEIAGLKNQLQTVEERYSDNIKEAKFNDYCVICERIATIFCCQNGSFKVWYCSEQCQEKDIAHKLKCSQINQISSVGTEKRVSYSKRVETVHFYTEDNSASTSVVSTSIKAACHSEKTLEFSTK